MEDIKIVAGVPTRNRDVTEIATRLLESPALEKSPIFIWSNGSVASYQIRHNNPRILWMSSKDQLGIARQRMVELATDHGAKYILQVDDDIRIPSGNIRAMVDILERFPTIGAVTSTAQLINYWRRDINPNSPFRVAAFPAQLWILRIEATVEAAEAFPPLFNLHTMEDLALGMKLWSLGWATVELNDPTLCHTPFITRHSKTEDMGGQPIEERVRFFQDSVQWLSDNVSGEGKPLKWIKLYQDKNGNIKHHIRYDWDAMTAKAIARFGPIGYSDAKGRNL